MSVLQKSIVMNRRILQRHNIVENKFYIIKHHEQELLISIPRQNKLKLALATTIFRLRRAGMCRLVERTPCNHCRCTTKLNVIVGNGKGIKTLSKRRCEKQHFLHIKKLLIVLAHKNQLTIIQSSVFSPEWAERFTLNLVKVPYL